jgi:hypothetical protein
MPGLTDAENRVHMSLWAISGAPLLVGADLSQLSDATLATLTNPAVIAIDQDALGLQAVKVREEVGGLEVWSKRLSKPGERAVLLLNRADEASSIVVAPLTVSWKDLGLAGSSATVSDPLAGKDLGSFDKHYTATVPRGDAVLLIVRGTEAKSNRILPSPTTKATHKGSGATQSEQTFSIKASACDQPFAAIQIEYRNPDASPRIAELRVNEQDATRIAFPSTGTGDGTVWIQVRLSGAGTGAAASSSLRFSSGSGQASKIDSIFLHRNEICGGSGSGTR